MNKPERIRYVGDIPKDVKLVRSTWVRIDVNISDKGLANNTTFKELERILEEESIRNALPDEGYFNFSFSEERVNGCSYFPVWYYRKDENGRKH